MQITAHNRHSHSLKSDSLIVIMVTLIVLMLSAFIGNACYSILTSANAISPMEQFAYVPSSFGKWMAVPLFFRTLKPKLVI